MRAVDPDIRLVASGSGNYGADWIGWNRTVLTALRNQIDYIALHTDINSRADDFERYMAWSQTIEQYIDITAGLIREARAGFEDALATALFSNAFFRHADVVRMANLAQFVDVIAPIMTSRDGLFLQPTYLPMVEYGRQRGATSLDVFVSAPTYTIDRRQPLASLDVSATFDPATRMVAINVLNRSRTRDLTTEVRLQDRAIRGALGVWELNHADLKATHTFGRDKVVAPVTRTLTPAVADHAFSSTFPAHSLTVLKMTVE